MRYAVARSSFVTSLTRYSHSWGLWLLLLIAPIGARFMIANDDGFGMQVAIDRHLPVMTPATIGVTLGVLVSTLLMPVGFLYLRSNVTRNQPWQIEEVTAASRVAIALGRFAADVGILFAVLAVLNLAGLFLGWLVGNGPLDPLALSFALWVVAGPSLMVLAAIRALVDARDVTRGGLGETAFFVIWLTIVAVPAVLSMLPSSYGANMIDMLGFVRPLAGPAPMKMGSFSIGFTNVLPGRVPLDVMAGVHAAGYLLSRLSWAVLAVALAALAGRFYAPHRAVRRPKRPGWLAQMMAGPPRAPATPSALPAPFAANAFANLVKAEFRLIGEGRLFVVLGVAAAAIGAVADYRQFGSPAALLLLVFALSGHGARSETMRALTRVAALSPAPRRLAFVIAGTGWALLMALPGAVTHLSVRPLMLGLAGGAGAAVIAIGLAAISRAAFAPRLVLQILWYGYFSTGGR
jgi:hypothetical protein